MPRSAIILRDIQSWRIWRFDTLIAAWVAAGESEYQKLRPNPTVAAKMISLVIRFPPSLPRRDYAENAIDGHQAWTTLPVIIQRTFRPLRLTMQ